MTRIIIANWKANPASLGEAQELFAAEMAAASEFPNIKTVICPPFVYIEELAKLSKSNLGAQNIFWEESGPFTGEVSPEMLKNLGVSHVLVGHSDRRYVMNETDEIINKKIKATLGDDMTPVLLVGEKKKGENKRQILSEQLMADLNGLSGADVEKTLFAYEPVWAISTNKNAEPDIPENTLEAINIIEGFLLENFKVETKNLCFLYGGSVTDKNVADFLSHPQISGAVIGGASLQEKEFAKILKIVSAL